MGWLGGFARALGHLLVVMLGTASLVFVVLRLTGDPAMMVAPPGATLDDLAAIRRELGLDRSIGVQYVEFLRKLAVGDRLTPKTCSGLTGEPVACAPQSALPKPKFSIAYMPAKVTTARLTPLTRSEATAVMNPTTSAATTPTSGAIGKSAQTPPALVSMCDIAYPVTPARPT